MPPFLLVSDSTTDDGIQYALKHAIVHEYNGFFSNFTVMLFITAGIIFLMAKKMNVEERTPRGIIRNAMESLLLFIRGMVRDTMGSHHGDKFVPFFCTLFLFIFGLNLMGMVPIPKVGGTATSNLLVTGALASIVIAVSIGSGFLFHGGGGFFKLFIPGGLPAPLIPLLFVLEFVGFFIKHGVLMVRLFANMLAGHLVIGAFLGLIPVLESYAVAAALSIPLSIFVSLLELLVCFLQAYVFTLLSVLFVGGMVHPDH